MRQNYCSNLQLNLYIAFRLLTAGCKTIIHAIQPECYPYTASNVIHELRLLLLTQDPQVK